MRDISIDLETLGTAPGSVILSLGAVAFDPATGVLDPNEFYAVINLEDSLEEGFKIDGRTLAWWLKQEGAAREVLSAAADPERSKSVSSILAKFFSWVYERSNGVDKGEIRIWGNGAAFDNVLLGDYYRAEPFLQRPWTYKGDMCLRTLRALRPDVKVEFEGTTHNALDDARHQAKLACAIIATLGTFDDGPTALLSP